MIEQQIADRSVQRYLSRRRSPHQQMVDAFMAGARQTLPGEPVDPGEDVRLLRAKLIFEEAMEAINGLGVQIRFHGVASLDIPEGGEFTTILNRPDVKDEDGKGQVISHEYAICGEFDLDETVDGCLDIKVVTTGTLSACGVSDEALQFEVDSNNLRKFAEGHTIRDDGKLVKPPNHPKPRISELIEMQRSA